MFEEVERTCDRVGILRQGKLAAVEGVDRLKADRRDVYKRQLYDQLESCCDACEHVADIVETVVMKNS